MSCIFCKISSGEIPSNKLYEDEKILAFYDIAPVAPVHFLIIPKEHCLDGARDIDSTNSHIIGYIFEKIPELARKAGITDGYRIVTNNGESAGQTVNHLHFHVVGGKELGQIG